MPRTVSQRSAVTKRQIREALTKHHRHEQAKRGERLVVHGYPYSHNPYLPHAPVADCYAGCVRATTEGRD